MRFMCFVLSAHGHKHLHFEAKPSQFFCNPYPLAVSCINPYS